MKGGSYCTFSNTLISSGVFTVSVSAFALLSNQNNYKGPLSMNVLINDVNCLVKLLMKKKIHLHKKN